MSEYKGSFPAPLSRTVLGRLGTERSESGVGGIGGAGSGSPAFPESFISSVEQVALLRARSILEGGKSPLLTSFLWVTLGRLYLQQHQQFIVDEDQPGQQQQPQQQRSLSLAELCGHEALLTTELCPEVYTLKGEILLRVPGESSSQEAPALEAFRLALHMGPPRGAALRGMAQVYMREPGSDRPRLLLALQAAQEALRDYVHDTAALALAADLCRRLSMDKLGEEYFSRALQLEETDPILPWASVIDLFYTSLS